MTFHYYHCETTYQSALEQLFALQNQNDHALCLQNLHVQSLRNLEAC